MIGIEFMIIDEEVFRENMMDESLEEINRIFMTKSINTLSIDFIREFRDKIDWKHLESIDFNNTKFLIEFKREIMALLIGDDIWNN